MKWERIILLGAVFTASAGAESIERFDWDGATRQVEGAGVHRVLEIKAPVINQPLYAVTGTVSYQDVKGDAYLEMWSHFADGGQYFSRTLAEMGPLQKISGTSASRPFVLPFDPMGKNPVKLVVNVVLPEGGSVSLGPVELIQVEHFGLLMATNSDAWWTGRSAGLIFGSLGAVFGCLCGLVGIFAGKGKGRTWVLGYYSACIALGLLALAAGIYARFVQQPYDVYYPLLLTGFLLGVICFGLRKQAVKRYAQGELDRMTVMDQA